MDERKKLNRAKGYRTRNQNKFHENQLLDKLKQNINAHTKNHKIKCKIRTIERVNAIIEKKSSDSLRDKY